MSIEKIEAAVRKLPPSELQAFVEWLEQFLAQAWDKQLEADIRAGKLARLGKQADEHFEAGRCKPL